MIGIADTPVHRERFDEMSIELAESFLEDIRFRRLNALRVYEELQAKKKEADDEKLAKKAQKLVDRMSKRINAVTTAMEALETLVKDAKSTLILIGSAQ